jgi:hypothetical protein
MGMVGRVRVQQRRGAWGSISSKCDVFEQLCHTRLMRAFLLSPQALHTKPAVSSPLRRTASREPMDPVTGGPPVTTPTSGVVAQVREQHVVSKDPARLPPLPPTPHPVPPAHTTCTATLCRRPTHMYAV